jgi:alpha-glucoside transport system substrate-binding protein
MGSSPPFWRAFVMLTVVAMLATGCGEGDDSGDRIAVSDSTTTASSTSTTSTLPGSTSATPSDRDGGAYWEQALAGEYHGASVELTVYEYDPQQYFELADRVRELTGIDLGVTVESSHQTLMDDLVAGRSPADIAAVQASDARLLADHEVVIDIRAVLGEAWLEGQYAPQWLDAALISTAHGDVMAGVMHTFEMGDVIFYAADDFEAAGYPVPRTWAELVSLSDVIKSEGGTPWCIGIEMDPITGWMVTPWLEDILLRTAPVEDHDRWIRDQLDMDSPQLVAAFDVLSEIWLTEGFVAGGPAAITRTDMVESVLPMFDEPPGCWFHLQRPWIADSFPASAVYGRDYDFFFVPPIEEARGMPMAAPITMMVMLEDRPEVRAVMAYLAQWDSVTPWLAAGSTLSPHEGTPAAAYRSELSQELARAVAHVDAIRPTVTHAGGITANSPQTRELLTDLVTVEARTGHIVELIADGAISASPHGAGIDDLELDLENLLDELLDVEIPPGTYFVAGSGGVQNMVVRAGKTITLQPNELAKIVLDVACANLQRDIPGEDDRFTVERERSGPMTRLMRVLDDTNAGYTVAQAATWIVSDNANYSDLGILITTPSRARAIDKAAAGRAMQLVDEAGIDIAGRRIWRDRNTIAEGADPSFGEWLQDR